MKDIFKHIVVAVLQYEAKLVLKRYKPKIVGVTGSVGKTSAKDAIFSVLATKFHVRKSEKSFNSELGVPLTILGLKNAWNNPFGWMVNMAKGAKLAFSKRKYPEWLVLEIGADRPGDIASITEWVRPDIAVVTRLSKVPVHVEFFGSPDDVIKEKSYLVRNLKQSGIAILNADDEDVASFASLSHNKPLMYGTSRTADFAASNVKILYGKNGRYRGFPHGLTFKVDYTGNSVPVNLEGTIGKQHMYPALAALAVAAQTGIGMVEAIQALSKHKMPRGRMRLIEGMKDTLIIDDTYNASPIAVEEALLALKAVETRGRKIAVIGDMMELGRFSVEAHKDIGQTAAKIVDVLVAVGVRAKYVVDGAKEAGFDERSIMQFEESREAGKFLEFEIKPNDIILIKGSQSMRMERAVQEIMAHPEQREKLLVRQEAAWLMR